MASSKPFSTADVPPQFLKSVYLVGNIPFRALATDPRVSYTLYIPQEHYNPDPSLQSTALQTSTLDPRYLLPKLPLLVTIHGSSRSAETCRNLFTAFADSERVAILAPLFPAGLDGETDLDSYKLLRSKTLRSDKALLDILDDVKVRWPGIETEKVLLAGYSGGGQFVQRFFYLYPERLLAVSIGAPGRATHLDFTKRWPDGIKDVEEVFGPEVKVDLRKIMEVKHLQLVVGGDDTVIHGGKQFWAWMAGMKKARTNNRDSSDQIESSNSGESEFSEMTVNRLDALKAVKDDWDREGIVSRLDVVDGVRHSNVGVHEAVQEFFRSVVKDLSS